MTVSVHTVKDAITELKELTAKAHAIASILWYHFDDEATANPINRLTGHLEKGKVALQEANDSLATEEFSAKL